MNSPILTGDQWFVAKPALEVSAEWQWGMTAFLGLLALAGLYYVVRLVAADRRPHLLYVFAGGALAIFYEPLGDLFAHVTYHEVGQITAVRSFGFAVPVWMIPAYVVAVSTSLAWNMGRLDRGVGMSQWMTSFLIMIPLAIGFELPLIVLGYIEYYQPQPLRIFGYPLWMACVNAAALMFIPAVLLHMCSRTSVAEERPWLLLPLTPLFVAGSHAAASLPYAYALNSTRDLLTINVMAWVAIAGAVFLTWVSGLAYQAFRSSRIGQV